jgi:hypothetical protein
VHSLSGCILGRVCADRSHRAFSSPRSDEGAWYQAQLLVDDYADIFPLLAQQFRQAKYRAELVTLVLCSITRTSMATLSVPRDKIGRHGTTDIASRLNISRDINLIRLIDLLQTSPSSLTKCLRGARWCAYLESCKIPRLSSLRSGQDVTTIVAVGGARCRAHVGPASCDPSHLLTTSQMVSEQLEDEASMDLDELRRTLFETAFAKTLVYR